MELLFKILGFPSRFFLMFSGIKCLRDGYVVTALITIISLGLYIFFYPSYWIPYVVHNEQKMGIFVPTGAIYKVLCWYCTYLISMPIVQKHKVLTYGFVYVLCMSEWEIRFRVWQRIFPQWMFRVFSFTLKLLILYKTISEPPIAILIFIDEAILYWHWRSARRPGSTELDQPKNPD